VIEWVAGNVQKLRLSEIVQQTMDTGLEGDTGHTLSRAPTLTQNWLQAKPRKRCVQRATSLPNCCEPIRSSQVPAPPIPPLLLFLGVTCAMSGPRVLPVWLSSS
jgi:hypothetical protein